MKPGPTTAQFRFACVHCRKMIRKPMPRTSFPAIMYKPAGPSCAECGTTLIFVGKYFEPPRRSDLKAWKQLEMAYFEPDSYRDATGRYRAKMPLQIAKQRQQETEQQYLSRAKGLKCRQRLQKRQERLASRSKPGRLLTSRTLTAEDRWLSREQRI